MCKSNEKGKRQKKVQESRWLPIGRADLHEGSTQ